MPSPEGKSVFVTHRRMLMRMFLHVSSLGGRVVVQYGVSWR